MVWLWENGVKKQIYNWEGEKNLIMSATINCKTYRKMKKNLKIPINSKKLQKFRKNSKSFGKILEIFEKIQKF
jgi:hypothetical protein